MKWLERYIYLDIHKILFTEFPIVLYEWLFKLKTQKNNSQGGEPTESTSFWIEQIKRINNLISRDVDFWVDSIIEGYITKFLLIR